MNSLLNSPPDFDTLRLLADRRPTVWPVFAAARRGAYHNNNNGLLADVAQSLVGWRSASERGASASLGEMTQLYGAAISIGLIEQDVKLKTWSARWSYLSVARAFATLTLNALFGEDYQQESAAAAAAIFHAGFPHSGGSPADYLKVTATMFMRRSRRVIADSSLKKYNPPELSRSRLSAQDVTLVSSSARLLQSIPPTTDTTNLAIRLRFFAAIAMMATTSTTAAVLDVALAKTMLVTWLLGIPLSTLSPPSTLPLSYPVFYYGSLVVGELYRTIDQQVGLTLMLEKMVNNYGDY